MSNVVFAHSFAKKTGQEIFTTPIPCFFALTSDLSIFSVFLFLVLVGKREFRLCSRKQSFYVGVMS